MKKYSRSLLFTSVSILIFLTMPMLVQAQVGDPGCDPLDPACPIDGGLSLLLAAGSIYGIKKIHSSNKKDASAF